MIQKLFKAVCFDRAASVSCQVIKNFPSKCLGWQCCIIYVNLSFMNVWLTSQLSSPRRIKKLDRLLQTSTISGRKKTGRESYSAIKVSSILLVLTARNIRRRKDERLFSICIKIKFGLIDCLIDFKSKSTSLWSFYSWKLRIIVR